MKNNIFLTTTVPRSISFTIIVIYTYKKVFKWRFLQNWCSRDNTVCYMCLCTLRLKNPDTWYLHVDRPDPHIRWSHLCKVLFTHVYNMLSSCAWNHGEGELCVFSHNSYRLEWQIAMRRRACLDDDKKGRNLKATHGTTLKVRALNAKKCASNWHYYIYIYIYIYIYMWSINLYM